MASRSPLEDKSPGRALGALVLAVGPAMAGFALGSAWLFLRPGDISPLVIAMIAPIALTPLFFRARD